MRAHDDTMSRLIAPGRLSRRERRVEENFGGGITERGMALRACEQVQAY